MRSPGRSSAHGGARPGRAGLAPDAADAGSKEPRHDPPAATPRPTTFAPRGRAGRHAGTGEPRCSQALDLAARRRTAGGQAERRRRVRRGRRRTRTPGGLAALARVRRRPRSAPGCATLAAENRRLLERGLAAQGRVIAVIARAARARPATAPRYGASGALAGPQGGTAGDLRADLTAGLRRAIGRRKPSSALPPLRAEPCTHRQGLPDRPRSIGPRPVAGGQGQSPALTSSRIALATAKSLPGAAPA